MQSRTGHAVALKRSQAPQPGEWAFGAGEQAITFVRRLDRDFYLELGRSWYAASKSYSRTPGHANEEGLRYRTFDPSAGMLSCFGCHSTGPVSVSANGNITPHELGVRCESCHGASEEHVRTPKLVHPSNPGSMTGEAMNEFCGACHRMPAPASATPNLKDPWNARHQPLLLSESRCFKASEGKLTCITCHSPHQPLERNLASYDAACSSCHDAVKHVRTTAGRACAACHMPAVQAQRNLTFTNHRISVVLENRPAPVDR